MRSPPLSSPVAVMLLLQLLLLLILLLVAMLHLNWINVMPALPLPLLYLSPLLTHLALMLLLLLVTCMLLILLSLTVLHPLSPPVVVGVVVPLGAAVEVVEVF